jgi:hypothetical protein
MSTGRKVELEFDDVDLSDDDLTPTTPTVVTRQQQGELSPVPISPISPVVSPGATVLTILSPGVENLSKRPVRSALRQKSVNFEAVAVATQPSVSVPPIPKTPPPPPPPSKEPSLQNGAAIEVTRSRRVITLVDYEAKKFDPETLRLDLQLLRKMMVGDVVSVLLTVLFSFLTIFFVIESKDNAALIIFTSLVTLCIGGASMRLIGHRSLLVHVPEMTDQYHLQKYTYKFREMLAIFCTFSISQLLATLFAISQIVFSTDSPNGILSSFDSMDPGGKSLFILFIINMFVGITFSTFVLTKVWRIADCYLVQFIRINSVCHDGTALRSIVTQ